MISVLCPCGTKEEVPESEAGTPRLCPSCQRVTNLVCAEALPEDAGNGDFDAQLTIVEGPQNVGERYLLGGVAEIKVGKLPDNHIQLPGQRVSRSHCTLQRLDFGPSRWQISDNSSTHGVLVNRKKVAQCELKPGDLVQLGDFVVRYDLMSETRAEFPTASVAQSAPPHLPAPIAAPAARAVAKPIAYAAATPVVTQAGFAPLAESDIKWVMQIRNGARMLSYAAIPVVVGRFLCALIPIIALPVSALLAGVAGWFLSAKEPEASENILWTIVRLLLKVTGTATGVAIPMLVIGGTTENMPLLMAGGFCTLAIPVYALLTMVYIFRMARRLPNTALAASALIVAIGLPTTLGVMVYGMFSAFSAAKAAGKPIGDSLDLVTFGIGYWLMYAFTWFYIIILFWFNRAFS